MHPAAQRSAVEFLESKTHLKEWRDKYHYFPCIRGTTEYYARAEARRDRIGKAFGTEDNAHYPEEIWVRYVAVAQDLQNETSLPSLAAHLENFQLNVGEYAPAYSKIFFESLKVKARDEICDELVLHDQLALADDVIKACDNWKSIAEAATWIDENVLSHFPETKQQLIETARDIFVGQVLSESVQRDKEKY